jgi:hypothetical protein
VGFAAKAGAQCGTYVVTPSSGAAIVAGTTDIGNHADDLTTPITLPFAFNFYGTSYAAANVSSNGNLQFGGADASGANACISGGNANGLPGPTMYPHWDDMRTNVSGRGIFTATYGASPNRSFAVEWRCSYSIGPNTGMPNFEIILYEGQTYFDFIYGTVDQGPGQVTLGASATVGVKATNTAAAAVTQYSCNSAVLSNGLRLRFDSPNLPPSCDLTFVPTDGAAAAGTSLHVYCRPTLGDGPVSPIASVIVDASPIGGGTVTLHDDGIPPDNTAGDGLFSGLVTSAAGTPLGPYTLTSTVTDGVQRSGTCSAVYTVIPPPPVNDECSGALPAALGLNAFDNAGATTSLPSVCSMFNDMWWTYRPPTDGVLTLSTCGLTTPEAARVQLAIYSGCSTWLSCATRGCGTNQSIAEVCVTGGQTYYLRIGGSFGSRWSGSFNLAFVGPTHSIQATQFPICGGAGRVLTLTASAYNLCPSLTGVTADCSQINAGTVTLLDNGVAPDTVAGDGTFSAAVTVGPVLAVGTKTITYTGAFSGGGTGTATTAFVEPGADEAGDYPWTATPAPSATSITGYIFDSECGGADADIYSIYICDPAHFSASTVGNGTTIDTQLFLFRSDGTGIAMNDDAPTGGSSQSRISNAFTSGLSPGTYLLAITCYNRYPIDHANAAPLWANGPRNVERAPDGPGAASALWAFTGGSAAGAYRIDLTGLDTLCPPPPGSCCSADYNGDGDVGTDSDIAAFFACLGGNCCPTCPPNADFNCDGDVGTDVDIASFFRVLAGGSC